MSRFSMRREGAKTQKNSGGLRVVFQAVLVGGAAGVFAEGIGEVALR